MIYYDYRYFNSQYCVTIVYVKILFIQTGGTIDKDNPRIKKSYQFVIADPAFERILKTVQPNFPYSILKLLKKDSLDLTGSERRKIAKACKDAKETYIIITHGTDTFKETAKFIADLNIPKKIILTGAIMPERFTNSDAPFNLGVAVGAIHHLADGVYIGMNGRIYEWDKCKKNDECVFVDA